MMRLYWAEAGIKTFGKKRFFQTKHPMTTHSRKLVILEQVDGHAAYVNSEVLNRADITAETKS